MDFLHELPISLSLLQAGPSHRPCSNVVISCYKSGVCYKCEPCRYASPSLMHIACCRLIHCIKYNQSRSVSSSTMSRKNTRIIQMVACGRLEMSVVEKARQDWILAVWCCRQVRLSIRWVHALNHHRWVHALNHHRWVHALNHCSDATFPHGRNVRFFKGVEFFRNKYGNCWQPLLCCRLGALILECQGWV